MPLGHGVGLSHGDRPQGMGVDAEGSFAGRSGAQTRVALVIPALGAGGAEKALSALAGRWVEAGWTVDLVTLEDADCVPFHPLDRRVRIVPLGLPPKKDTPLRAGLSTATRILRLRRALLAARPDVVVSFLTRTNILTLLAMAGTGIPVIVSERNNPHAQVVNAGWRLLRRSLYPRAFAVAALTREALDCYPASVRERGVIIPNAFDMPVRLAPPSGPPTIVAAGRLVEQKGFDLLLRAFAKIANGPCKDWRLVIWGEGPARADLERLRDALGLADRVAFPGVTARPYGWIEGAHVFVLSSRYEGLANVVGEAMAAGLPTVAFDCDWGPREFIEDGHSGILVEPGNVAALADALALVAADAALRARLGAAARAGMTRFSPDQVLARWDEIVGAAIAFRRRPASRLVTGRSILAASLSALAALPAAGMLDSIL